MVSLGGVSRTTSQHGIDDRAIAGAAAQDAGERILDFGGGRGGRTAQERGGTHQHARRADAALRGVVAVERVGEPLHRRHVPEPRQRGDAAPLRLARRHQAGAHRRAVEEHGAGAAVARIAADLDVAAPRGGAARPTAAPRRAAAKAIRLAVQRERIGRCGRVRRWGGSRGRRSSSCGQLSGTPRRACGGRAPAQPPGGRRRRRAHRRSGTAGRDAPPPQPRSRSASGAPGARPPAHGSRTATGEQAPTATRAWSTRPSSARQHHRDHGDGDDEVAPRAELGEGAGGILRLGRHEDRADHLAGRERRAARTEEELRERHGRADPPRDAISTAGVRAPGARARRPPRGRRCRGCRRASRVFWIWIEPICRAAAFSASNARRQRRRHQLRPGDAGTDAPRRPPCRRWRRGPRRATGRRPGRRGGGPAAGEHVRPAGEDARGPRGQGGQGVVERQGACRRHSGFRVRWCANGIAPIADVNSMSVPAICA